MSYGNYSQWRQITDYNNNVYTSRQDACAGRIVPPPTVPTSKDGIVQLQKRIQYIII